MTSPLKDVIVITGLGGMGLATARRLGWAHCSGGPRQRPSSAPPLQPSPSTSPLVQFHFSIGTF